MAQTISLSLSPPLIETMVKPGKSLLVAYTLENNADPAIMHAYVRSFEPKGNTGAIKIKDELEGPVHFSLDNSDIELDKPFFMKPNGSQQLLLRIRIPEGAPEGDYYYTLLASSEPPSMAISSSASGARATIGANILITVTQSGYTKVNAKIALFDVLSHFSLPFIGKIHLFDSSDKVPVSFKMKSIHFPKIDFLHIAHPMGDDFEYAFRLEGLIINDKVLRLLFGVRLSSRDKIDEKTFFEILKTGFAHKRKVVIKNLQDKIDKNTLESLWNNENWSKDLRAENITLEMWKKIVGNTCKS
jgi:hypothetical protein